MQKILEDEYLWVDNIGQAAALALLYPLQKVRVNPFNDRKVQYAFTRSPQVMTDGDMYWNGNLILDALAFYTQLQTMRVRANELLPKKY